MRVLIILILLVLVVGFAYSSDISFSLGSSFYGDGVGGVLVIGVGEKFEKLLGVAFPLYGKFSLMGEYARGVEGDYYVDVIDIGAFIGVELTTKFENFGIGVGIDFGGLYFYGSGQDNNLSSFVFRVIPKGIVSYMFTDSFSVLGEVGYSAGISSFYLGNMYFSLGIRLGV